MSSVLTHRHKLVACLDASGRTVGEIAEELRVSPSYVKRLQEEEGYQDLVDRELEVMLARVREKASTAFEIFSSNAVRAAKEIVAMMQVADRDSVRLKAAQEVIAYDREISAFKARTAARDVPRVVIQISDRSVENMERALGDVGGDAGPDRDVIDIPYIPLPEYADAKGPGN